MPERLRGRDVVLLAALLSFVAGLGLQPMAESDLFFRLRVGQEILSRHGLVGRNLFSFTAPDHPDLDLAWAFEVGVALVYRAAGFAGVVVAKTAALVAVFAAGFAICRRRGAGPLATTLALAGAAFVMRDRFVERPHVVSFAGEVVVLAALTALARPWGSRAVLGFALAMVAWANAHAGVFAGMLMLGLAALAWAPVDRSAARRGMALAVVAAGAACATPTGPLGLARYLALHLSLPRLHQVDEFRSATWRSDAPFFLWLMLVAAVVAASVGAAAVVERRAARTSDGGARVASLWASVGPDLLSGLGLVVLGLATVRFSADAVLVTAPLLAVRASTLVAMPDFAPARRAFARHAPVTTVAVALALVAAAVAPRVASARAGRRAIDVGVDWSEVPIDAIHFVDAHGLHDRMYNDFEVGSYLIFEGYPRHRVFVDPRLPAYPEDLHRVLGAFDLDRETWGRVMDKYGVDAALLAYAGVNRRVAWWDPETWALVYRAGDARVFVRRLDRWRGVIAAFEIPATFDFTVEEGTVTRPLERAPSRSPVPACVWQARLGDLIFDLDGGAIARAAPHYDRALATPGCLPPAADARLAAWLGAIELGAAHADRAVALLGRAIGTSPSDTRTRANYALALGRVGRRADAASEWTRVAREASGTPLGDAAAARVRRRSAN